MRSARVTPMAAGGSPRSSTSRAWCRSLGAEGAAAAGARQAGWPGAEVLAVGLLQQRQQHRPGSAQVGEQAVAATMTTMMPTCRFWSCRPTACRAAAGPRMPSTRSWVGATRSRMLSGSTSAAAGGPSTSTASACWQLSRRGSRLLWGLVAHLAPLPLRRSSSGRVRRRPPSRPWTRWQCSPSVACCRPRLPRPTRTSPSTWCGGGTRATRRTSGSRRACCWGWRGASCSASASATARRAPACWCGPSGWSRSAL